jgi:ribosomal protein S20
MRAAVRSLRAGGGSMSEEDKQQRLSALYSLLDVQARKGIIHKKKAARLKSRMASQLQK